MVQNGRSPLVANSAYKVWRNIKDYGAVGDGLTDDTAAINKAISDGNRCGIGCGSSTALFAVVYFPPGTYLVSSSITQYYMTQFVGHPTNRPVIKANSSFVGLGVISSNVYIDGGDGASWYINQNNFFRQIRNFVIDLRDAPKNDYIAGLHWQIAQATSLQNILFRMSTVPGNNQQGIFMENGSGGMFYDLEFEGGTMGAYVGNQQFTVRNLKFSNHQSRAIEIHWDWGWTWKGVQISNCPVGVFMSTPGPYTQVGSAMFLDSTFTNTPVGFKLQAPTNTAKISLSLFNLQTNNVPAIVQYDGGATLLSGGGSRTIASWGLGKRYDTDAGEASGVWQPGTAYPRTATIRPGLLRGTSFFERSKPQYENLPASSFINVKLALYSAAGDGVSDDTAKINSALAAAASSGRVLWFPAGIYMVSNTVFVPSGAKMVGQVWSQIMASGSNFQNANAPRPVVRVGNKGDSGVVEIQDLLFTVKGPNPGAVILEWNIHESSPGSAAMWDTHIRVGGALGTNLQTAHCPKLTGRVNPNCIAAHTLVHLTSTASAYFENTWFWVADHDLDIPAQTQIDIYVARGVLIESTRPVWLYGTGSEHCVLYQYQFVDASQVFMGMIQTESPYFQATPHAPAPFANSLSRYDPDFSTCSSNSDRCAVSWAVRIINSQDSYLYGGGLYSWFSKYSQDCLDTEDCQQKLVQIESSSNIWLLHLITKAAVEMISPAGGRAVLGADNKLSFCSVIMAWLGSASQGGSEGSGGVRRRSPISATVIPFPATTVAPTSTFTIGGDSGSVGNKVVGDIDYTPREGDQNIPPGPGEAVCFKCDLFRLITSTCCGNGGGVSNPIEIAPDTTIPRDLILPEGFVPSQRIYGNDGVTYQPGVPLPREVVVPKGTHFPFPLIIPAGAPLSDKYSPDPKEDDLNGTLYIAPAIWDGDRTVSCYFPCTLVLPPYPTRSTWRPPVITHSATFPVNTVITVTPTPETTQKIQIKKTTVRNDDSEPTIIVVPIPLPKPPCIKFTVPVLDVTITIGFCPPNIQPFPPVPPIPAITLIPVPPGRQPGPINPGNKPKPDQRDNDDDDDDDDDGEVNVCPWSPGDSADEYEWDGTGSWDPTFGEFPEDHPEAPSTTSRPGAGTGSPTTRTSTRTETVVWTSFLPDVTITSTVWVTVQPPPEPTQTNPRPPSPDPSQNKLHCFTSGEVTWKSNLRSAIPYYCSRWAGETINKNQMLRRTYRIDEIQHILMSFVSKNNCEFQVEENECEHIFGDIERGCGPTQLTRGGRIEGNCYDIFLDPNQGLGQFP